MVDLEPMEKQGKELPAGYALLRRLKSKLGTGFVDLILGSGLYLNTPFFNLCLGEMKSDVLVKTDEKGLRIIQDAVGMLRLACDIVTVCGVDTMRVRSYQITQAGGFFSRWHRHTTDSLQSRRGRHTYRRSADLLGRDFGKLFDTIKTERTGISAMGCRK